MQHAAPLPLYPTPGIWQSRHPDCLRILCWKAGSLWLLPYLKQAAESQSGTLPALIRHYSDYVRPAVVVTEVRRIEDAHAAELEIKQAIAERLRAALGAQLQLAP